MNARNETAKGEDPLTDSDPTDGAAIQRLLDKPLSLDDLQNNTRHVAKPLQVVEKDIVRLLVFQLGEERMAFKAVEVHHVTKATAVHRIPHRSNTIIRGLCNWDGALMLCADLARLLELRDSGQAIDGSKQSWMIVFGEEQNRWVAEVDSVSGVIAVPRRAFRQPPITVTAALGRCTESLVPVEQGTAALLDLDRIVSGFQAALR